MVKPLKRHITKIEQGWSPSAEARSSAVDEWDILKSGCANKGVFDKASHKAFPADLIPHRELEVKAEDIMICRASGSLHLIGSVALVEDVRARLFFSDKTYRIHLDKKTIDKRFFVFSMAAKHVRE